MENPREIIDDKYQAFIDNDSINMNYTKLEYVYKSYIGLLDKVDAVSMLMKERQFLTELHLMGPLCYVHVSPYYTTGADVFSGDGIGGIYDGTKLHFKKYGAHTHYFPPLNDDLENEFSMPVPIHQIGESPDILHSIDLITIFTFTALDSFMTYKTNQ